MLEADRGLAGGKVLGIQVGLGEGRTYPPPHHCSQQRQSLRSDLQLGVY